MSRIVRLATPSDAADIAAIYAPSVVDRATSFELEPPSPAEMATRIASTLVTHPWLVLRESEQTLGYAYACPHRTRAAYQWSCEVSVYIGEHAQRRGVGRTLYRALFPILERLGYYNAYAGIVLPNDGSVGLHEALGFKHLGTFPRVGFKLGAWQDVGWWHLALGTPGLPDRAPLRFADLDPRELERIL